jgi:hypothetical protein
MNWKSAVIGACIAILVVAVPTAHAQTAASTSPWSFDAGIGWDNGISGNVNSSGAGQINDEVIVVTSNTYEDVYGTGLHLRLGGGYMLSDDLTEVRGTFTWQSLDADQLIPMGDIGTSNLYASYTDYQNLSLDVGLRRYLNLTPRIRPYGEGQIGIGFIDETDVTLVAPGADFAGEVTDFYDQTAAFTWGFNFGVLFQTGGRVGFYGQLGFRYVTGMSEVDQLVGTGLEDINDKSSRWTMPFVTGVRLGF